MNCRYDVIGLGIAAVDDLLYVEEYPPTNVKVPILRCARQPGGLACTALAAVGGLSGKAAYLARLGQDDLSEFIRTSLAGRGVDVSAVISDAQAQPFHSTIVIDASGRRTIFYDAARFRQVAAEDVAADLVRSARMVFLDYLVDPPAIEVARKIRGLGVPMLADIEGRNEACRPLLPLIDYLIVSEEFARWAAGTEDLLAACAFLGASPRAATVVTAGAQGCYLSTMARPAPVQVPAFKIDPVDTNGCGDVFHGAFALGAARGLEPGHAAIFAAAAAALKAIGKGGWASLPSAADVLSLLQSRLSPSMRENAAALMACAASLAADR